MLSKTGKWLRVLSALALAFSLFIVPVSAIFAGASTRIFVGGEEFLPSSIISRIEGVTYVPLRDFVLALDETAEFSWNEDKKTAFVYAQGLEIRVPQNEQYIVANGRYLYLYGTVRNQDGTLTLPIRPLAEAFGVSVSWDAESQSVFVSGEVEPILPGWAFYDETSVYWLSHIIYAEAGGESLDGQIAVGQVVLNRVANTCWPDNIRDVLFDDRCGVQFSPTENGTIYMEPSGLAVAAAKMALEGADVVGDSYYFLNPDISSDRWFERNCEYVTTIGSHRFYTGGLW